MNALPRSNLFMTVEEYLGFEEQSDVRHEYVGGEVQAMAGASRRHGQIVMNIAGHLWSALRHGTCETHTNDVKVQAAPDFIYYPDVVVTCSSDERDPLVIRHPVLVVEVLSPGAAATDRREKMIYYRNIPSLLCYLIVHQDERRLEKHWRGNTGDPWEYDLLLEALCSEIKIPELDVQLTFDEVYEGVSFDS
jgi:Uma2 family endonuclease